MVGQLIMLAQEGGGAEGCGDGSGDGQADQVIGAGGGIGLLGRFLLFGGADDDDGAGVIGGGIATRLGSATIDTSTGMIEFVVLLFNYCSTTSIAGYLVGSITIIRINEIASMVTGGRFVISTIFANVTVLFIDMFGFRCPARVSAAFDRAYLLMIFAIERSIDKLSLKMAVPQLAAVTSLCMITKLEILLKGFPAAPHMRFYNTLIILVPAEPAL